MVVRYSKQYEDDLKKIATAMHQEAVRFCNQSLNLNKLIRIANDHYCGLYLKEGKPVGAMLGYAGNSFFGDDILGSEIGLFVFPEHRGSLAAVRLVQDFEKWCKEQGCAEINVGSSVQVATDTVEKLYNKLGFVTRGFVAYKEL